MHLQLLSNQFQCYDLNLPGIQRFRFGLRQTTWALTGCCSAVTSSDNTMVELALFLK